MEACRAAQAEQSREENPLEWGRLQYDLAHSLYFIDQTGAGTARLEEAITAFRELLEIWTPGTRDENSPNWWSGTQWGLGKALSLLGQREMAVGRWEKAIAHLEEAGSAYRAAQEEQTRELDPLGWAMIQDLLADALHNLGVSENCREATERGKVRLEEAVAAYRIAAEAFTRERWPQEWAGTHEKLGRALEALGELENGTTRLQDAVAAHRAALAVWNHKSDPEHPHMVAHTHENLGHALAVLGRREIGTESLLEALAAFRAALELRTRHPKLRTQDGAANARAWTQCQVGIVLLALASRDTGTTRIWEAIADFHAALDEWTRERVPDQWAVAECNLGRAFHMLGKREAGTVHLGEAVAAYRAAQEVWTRERVPEGWATTQSLLGDTLMTLAEREKKPEYNEEAIAAYRAALTFWRRERTRFEWATTQGGLGNALLEGARGDGAAERLAEAAVVLKSALDEMTSLTPPHLWKEMLTRF